MENTINTVTSDIKRGEAYWCKDRFLAEEGNIVPGDTTHPYIIVSDNNFNAHGCYVLAVMITTKEFDCPTNTVLTGYQNLKKSTVKAGCIHIMPKALIGDHICHIRRGDMLNIEYCMQLALGLPAEE